MYVAVIQPLDKFIFFCLSHIWQYGVQIKRRLRRLIPNEIRGEEPSAVYYHEIAAIIDEGGADSIYLHYGVWDDYLYNLKKGRFWGWAKDVHDKFWRRLHK